MGEEKQGNSETRKPWWHNPSIILQILTIAISLTSVTMIYGFNQQNPDLKTGLFPMSSAGTVIPNYGRIASSFSNENTAESNITVEEGYKFANITFQVANTGKGTAYDVNVIVRGIPNNECKVISVTVYAGEPTETNCLGTKKDEYFVGMLLPGRFYVFEYSLKWPITSNNEETFVLTATSGNGGTKEFIISVN